MIERETILLTPEVHNNWVRGNYLAGWRH